MTSGSPRLENVNCNFSIVTTVVLASVTWTYLEWESTSNKTCYTVPKMDRRSLHELSMAAFEATPMDVRLGGGSGAAAAHMPQPLTFALMSLSILGHHTYCQAKLFIL